MTEELLHELMEMIREVADIHPAARRELSLPLIARMRTSPPWAAAGD